MANTKLWIDDLRIPPDDTFDIARTYEEACDALWDEKYEQVYLDHDLACWDNDGSGRELTGYSVVLWLAEMQAHRPDFHIPKQYFMLTDNPVGRQSMSAVITRYLGTVEQWSKPADLKSLEPSPVRVFDVTLKWTVPIPGHDEVIARGKFYFDHREGNTGIGMTLESWRKQHLNILHTLYKQELLVDGKPYGEDDE